MLKIRNQNILKTSVFYNKGTVFLLILIFYILFPTNNSSLDSYAYAGYVKYNHFLFTPHHLFSNAIIYILLQPFQYLGLNIDILAFSKVINSLFQLLNLFIFYKILTFLKINEKSKLLYILILAFSFSLWRYGTENETYIIPITFSLLGSFYFLKNIKSNKNTYIILSSLFGVIACLFHQIHFFWWFGLLFGFYFYTKRIQSIILYSLPALLVPLSYALVIYFYENQEITILNLWHFVFHDLHKGSVMTNFGWKGFFFQALNTVRTYFQIHPNIYLMIKDNLMYVIPIIACAFIFFRTLILFIRNRKLISKKENNLSLFIIIHVCIFTANYLFAFYNYGNIEFMVMLPFLVVLYIVIRYEIDYKILQKVAILLFIWNFSYGILPNYIYDYYNDKKLVDYMVENKDKTFIIKSHTTRNEYFYLTGIRSPKNILIPRRLTQDSVNYLIKKNNELYTDIINKPEILNKEKMIEHSAINFDDYKKTEMFSYKGFYGKSTVYKLESKK